MRAWAFVVVVVAACSSNTGGELPPITFDLPDAQVDGQVDSAVDARMPDARVPVDAKVVDAAPPPDTWCGYTGQHCCNGQPNNGCVNAADDCVETSLLRGEWACEPCGHLGEYCCWNKPGFSSGCVNAACGSWGDTLKCQSGH